MLPFSYTHLICFALAAAAGVPIFFLTKPSLGISTSAMLMVVIMLPFIFFAPVSYTHLFDIEKYRSRKLVVKPTQTFDLYDMGEVEAD